MIRRRRAVTGQSYQQDARQAVELTAFRKNLRDTVKMYWWLVTAGEDEDEDVGLYVLYFIVTYWETTPVV